jgi:hypothetical protein
MKLFFLVCFIILNSCVIVKNSLFKKFYYLPKVYQTFYTQLPYEVINGFIIVEIKVNGKTCRLMVDTGSRSYISKNMKDQLNMNVFDSTFSIDITGKRIEVEKVRGLLEFGSLQLFDFKFTVKDNFFSICDSIDGILGNEIFNQGVFYFNHSNHTITITNTISQIHDSIGFTNVSIKNKIGDLTIKHEGLRYTLDSGFSNGFICTNKKSDLLNSSVNTKELNKRIDGLNSEKYVNILYQAQNVNLFRNEFQGIICFTDEIKANLLGSDWFTNNDLILDLNNKKIYIRKGEEKFEKSIESISNFSFGHVNNTVLIDGVSSQIKMIHVGDIVQKINGIDVINIKSKCELLDFCKSLNYEEGLTLTILKENKQEEYYFTKHQIFN